MSTGSFDINDLKRRMQGATPRGGQVIDIVGSRTIGPRDRLLLVQVGKELLVTRGALTTFSVANDVAKYFAILPALFAGIYPQLGALNLMQLHSPQSAILSAIVFNALIIVALIPLALRGVRIQALDAGQLLRRNLLIYGLGGLLAPFVGIKLLDLLLVGLGWV